MATISVSLLSRKLHTKTFFLHPLRLKTLSLENVFEIRLRLARSARPRASAQPMSVVRSSTSSSSARNENSHFHLFATPQVCHISSIRCIQDHDRQNVTQNSILFFVCLSSCLLPCLFLVAVIEPQFLTRLKLQPPALPLHCLSVVFLFDFIVCLLASSFLCYSRKLLTQVKQLRLREQRFLSL